jgi:hypothetical protein
MALAAFTEFARFSGELQSNVSETHLMCFGRAYDVFMDNSKFDKLAGLYKVENHDAYSVQCASKVHCAQ